MYYIRRRYLLYIPNTCVKKILTMLGKKGFINLNIDIHIILLCITINGSYTPCKKDNN